MGDPDGSDDDADSELKEAPASLEPHSADTDVCPDTSEDEKWTLEELQHADHLGRGAACGLHAMHHGPSTALTSMAIHPGAAFCNLLHCAERSVWSLE